MQSVTTHTTQLPDGRRIAYCSESVFKVQIGRGAKGAYRTRYSFKGDLHKAYNYYRAINIGNGYKKRLFCETLNKPVLLRWTS